VGRQLLQRLGWQEGIALGKTGGAANAPIEVHKKADNAGIGMHDRRAVALATVGGVHGGSCSKVGVVGNAALVIEDGVDSEKTKAWKRMMIRYSEPR
jgi:hypothetical protein